MITENVKEKNVECKIGFSFHLTMHRLRACVDKNQKRPKTIILNLRGIAGIILSIIKNFTDSSAILQIYETMNYICLVLFIPRA